MVAGEGGGGPRRGGTGAFAEPTVRQMRVFLVLSRELHFGRTADLLFVTQSALSRQIRDLEGRLGLRLFERTSRTVELTDAGRALLPEIRAAVEAADRLRRAAAAQTRRLSGELVAGVIGAEAFMPHTRAVLAELRRRHPEVAVRVVSLGFADHVAALTREEADVVFLRPPVPEGIEFHRLAVEPRVACLPAGDPLAAEPRLTTARLAGYPVVDIPPEAPRGWWDFWAVDPRPDGSRVRYGPAVADMEALLHAVTQGGVMSFLPAAARDFFPRPGVRYVDVTDLPPSASAVAWLARNRDRPTVAAVRRAATAVTRSHRRPGPPGVPDRGAARPPSGTG